MGSWWEQGDVVSASEVAAADSKPQSPPPAGRAAAARVADRARHLLLQRRSERQGAAVRNAETRQRAFGTRRLVINKESGRAGPRHAQGLAAAGRRRQAAGRALCWAGAMLQPAPSATAAATAKPRTHLDLRRQADPICQGRHLLVRLRAPRGHGHEGRHQGAVVVAAQPSSQRCRTDHSTHECNRGRWPEDQHRQPQD